MAEMKPEDITYAFEGGKTYAIHQGKVIAAHEDFDVVERQVKQAFDDMGGPNQYGDMPGDSLPNMDPQSFGPGDPSLDTLCPQCGTGEGAYEPQSGHPCAVCGFSDPQAGLDPQATEFPAPPSDLQVPGQDPQQGLPPAVGHTVTTPNGLKGTVLGKVAGLWSDEVTVRLENGRIVKLPVSTDLTFSSTKTASAPVSAIDRLEARLASTPDGTITSLQARAKELETIANEVSNLVSTASYADQQRLDTIRVTADVERAEVNDAIAYLDDEAEQTFRPPAPAFSINPVEQESMGGLSGDWLDQVTNDMIAEAEAQDYGKLMDEGPEAFAAEVPDAAIGDAGAVRSMASSYISEKTAGTDPESRTQYMSTWLARVEQCRRAELSTRKQVTKKEAAAEESVDFSSMPDSFLW